MSVSAWLTITLLPTGANRLIPKEVFERLLGAGWTFNDNGMASYLPLGDADDFGWQRMNASDTEIMNLVEAKARANEVIGVAMTWRDSGVGGEFLLEGDSLSMSLSINRVKIQQHESLTDVSWYLPKLIPCLNLGTTRVASLKYEEYP